MPKRAQKQADVKRVKITLVKSTTGFNSDQAKVVQGMGLRRIGHSVELADTPATRGMIHKVRHLVKFEETGS
jgi:large subunit ribosomal protein L30